MDETVTVPWFHSFCRCQSHRSMVLEVLSTSKPRNTWCTCGVLVATCLQWRFSTI